MRLIHTADWHLGVTLGGFSLLREQQGWADELVQAVRRERADAVLVAGDVFDRAVASAGAIALYDALVTRLVHECGVRVLLLAGNHDGAARLTQLSGLLCGAGVFLAGSLTARPEPVELGDAQCFLIPFLNPEQARLLYPEADVRTADGAMRAVMDDVRARRDPAKKLIVGAHCFVTGASPAESDYGAQLGGAAQVGADAFGGADYVALGHLHRAQTVAPGVRYSGAPYPYAFSEGGCGATLYDSESGEVRELVFAPARTLRAFRGTYDEALAFAENDPRREDYMKLELTDRAAGLETLDTFRALYPNLVTLLGKTAGVSDAGALSVEEVRTLSPRALLARFCEEHGGFTPSEEQTGAFLQALARVREGGGAQ